MTRKKQAGHPILKVEPGSIGEELELEPGDLLLEINGNPVEDIFDYEYYVDSPSLTMLVQKSNGEEWELEIENDYEDLGLTFENGLMSDYRSCCNKCIFCFIDQMPPGMRDTLYFKDDDSRLSFLQGNYVTLTNMKE
ncbi:MAG TPA: radical SAM protein, partial [Candidatus Enterocloster faecavium]|nr:radical SAM protein [Candidatus Enterocloster faecavium]